jgi:hypothetical protein
VFGYEKYEIRFAKAKENLSYYNRHVRFKTSVYKSHISACMAQYLRQTNLFLKTKRFAPVFSDPVQKEGSRCTYSSVCVCVWGGGRRQRWREYKFYYTEHREVEILKKNVSIFSI